MKNFSDCNNDEKNQYAISVMKGLVMDATRRANSGHPGGPMSCADFAYILFHEYLSFDPDNSDWFNRDRFILSGGHMSMLQYSLLFLIGWLEKEDLENFRQLHSKTPGHPEVEISGVECTTGPLGQGFGMGVGMAQAEAYLKSLFSSRDKGSKDIIDHFTYVLASDGDLQEPISLGSASLAGHLGLSKLVVFYDRNEAQISGHTNRSDSTNYNKVFEGFGWHVQEIDGHDHNQIRTALENAKNEKNMPSIIIGNTIMAKGTATLEGDHNTHGAPLPQDEIDATKVKLGLADEAFFCPEEVFEHFRKRFPDLKENALRWENLKNSIANSNTSISDLLESCINDKLPKPDYPNFDNLESVATRKAFGTTLDHFSKMHPNLIGGSADLEPSNYTGNFAKNYGDFTKELQQGRNIPFGVREFPMAAMMNGMALHGGIIPFGGTFLVFSDYERPALRMAAIQGARVIHEFTHDSFFVGEDGPTHQPVEHIMSLRTIPNFNVYRPADAKETAICFRLAIENKRTPSALLLTRQSVPLIELDYTNLEEGVRKGAYIVKNCEGPPEIIFMATGSEVSLALATAKKITDKKVRVISMPCLELFDRQSDEYKIELIPKRGCLKVSIEAGVTQGWSKYIGSDGFAIGLDHYGASAPAKELAIEFGFTAEAIEAKVRNHITNLL